MKKKKTVFLSTARRIYSALWSFSVKAFQRFIELLDELHLDSQQMVNHGLKRT